MMKKFFILVISCLALFYGVGITYACSCAGISIEEEFKGSDAVFMGKITEIKEFDLPFEDRKDYYITYHRVSVTILESYKGSYSGDITLYTDGDSAACGYPFTKNKEYVIFAYLSEKKELWTGLCSNTTGEAVGDPVELEDKEHFNKVKSAVKKLAKK